MTNSNLPESVRLALERTARTVRKEEFLLTLCQAVVGTCVFFGLVVLVEHWIMPRGLPAMTRALLDLVFWGACVWAFCRRILPFLIWKLNPFYLASVIEKARPDLKNGLLNLLYLKKAPPTPAGNLAVQAVSKQITGTEEVPYFPPERIRWWKWGAAAAVILCVLYSILSPKSALRSVARTLFPWANISVPTRVRIDAVQPGDFTLYQGETFEVSARFRRLKENETPVLFYSSEDKKFVNAPVSMSADPEKPRFWSAQIPDVQQNLTWRLEAGDAQSETFQLTVLPPLRVTIESLRLTPPKYTGLPTVTQTAGDVQAVTGTRIDLVVRTSEPAREVTLKLDGKHAVKFTPVEEKGRTSQMLFRVEFQETYVPGSRVASIHFENEAGRANEPLKYRWEILPDAGPEVRILEGPKDLASLDQTEETTVKISASDPDFGLRAVAFRAEWNGKPLAIPPLLNLPRDRAGLRTPFEAEFVLRPSEWDLKAGDEIVWWAEAADTQEPAGNRSRTGKRRLRIVGETPEKKDPSDDSNDLKVPGFRDDSEPDGQEKTPPDAENEEEKSPFPVSAEMPNQEDAKAQGEDLEGEESPESSDENAGQTDSRDGEKTSSGEKSGRSEAEKDESKEGQENGQNSGSGDGESQGKGESKGDSSPKTAEDGYDPLSESEARDDETGKSGENPGESKQDEGEKSSDSGEKSGESGEKSGETGESGESDDQNTPNEDDAQRGKRPNDQSPQTASGQKSGEKGNGKRQEKGQQSDLEQETDAESGEELEERGENGKKTGPESQNGAKSESEAPEDVTSAQSGLQNGSDSNQDLPDPVKEKENSDGSGLQDSNSNRPNRDKMEDDSDETGEPNAENSRPAGKDEMEGSKPDPVSNPGEAMEEILKHRQQEMQKTGNLPPNPDSPSDKKGDSQALPPQSDAQAQMGDEQKELKKNEPNPEANQGGGENKKEKKSGQSSPQDGSQQGNAGDQKSKTGTKPDNSAEANGSAGKNKGGNRQGSQEQSDQQGLGRDGSNTPNESGNPVGSGGEGPEGERGGNSALADHPTGSADPNQTQGNGSDSSKGGRESQSYGSGQSIEQEEHATTSGGSGLGSEMRTPMGEESSATPSAKEDEVNVEFARQQTVLALDHLRDALDRDDDSLLEYLGWTREEARQFLKEWEKLNQDLNDPRLSEKQIRERQDAFRSLGITPRTIQYKDRTKKETVRPNARGGRKVEAPEAWREQFEAYSRGVGEGK